MTAKQKVKTTVGDLVVALTDEAARIEPSERERYRLVAAALTHLLQVSVSARNDRRLRRQLHAPA